MMTVGKGAPDDLWLDDPVAFAQAAAAARRFIELCAPAIEPRRIETTGLPPSLGAVLQTAFNTVGVSLADQLATEIVLGAKAGTNKARAMRLRALLSEDIVANVNRNIQGKKI